MEMRSVRHRPASLLVTFDRALESFPFGCSCYIDFVTRLENIYANFLTDFIVVNICTTDFTNVALRGCVCFSSMAFFRFSGARRSEEHTSELQSRFDLVCRLLLEKKNKLVDPTKKAVRTIS